MRSRFAHLELESDFIDWGSGSNRAAIYSRVLYARATDALGAGKQYPGLGLTYPGGRDIWALHGDHAAFFHPKSSPTMDPRFAVLLRGDVHHACRRAGDAQAEERSHLSGVFGRRSRRKEAVAMPTSGN
jgi:hypothetical protein